MALAWVLNATANNATGTAVTGSLGTTAAGQLIVITIVDDSAGLTSVTSVTDTYGNTWTRVATPLASTATTQMWYSALAVGGASHTVTVNWSTAATGRVAVGASYFNGFVGTPTLDVSRALATGSSTAPNSGATGTTTAAAEVVVGGFGHGGTTSAFTVGAGYTNPATVNVANAAVLQESKIVSATAAMTANATIAASRTWQAMVATFKDVATATPTVTTPSVLLTSDTAATADGNVTSDGGSTITQRGFAYGTSLNPTIAGSTVVVAGTTGTYSGNITGLTTNTTYHVRAYATNANGTSYGADIAITPVPLIATLTDDYDDGTRGAQWTQYTNGATISETGGVLQFAMGSGVIGYNGYSTNTIQNYCLYGSNIQQQVVSAGNQSLTSLEVYPMALTYDANNNMFIYISGNTIAASVKIAGTPTSVGTLAYNTTNHKYFRIRESGGTTYFETTDIVTNGSWTLIGSTTTPDWAGSVWVDVESGEYASEASTTNVQFDNLNNIPASNITATPGLATLTLTSFAPVVTATDTKVATPPTTALTLTSFAPNANIGVNVVPPTTALTITSFVPAVAATAHVVATPPTTALTLTPLAPQLKLVVTPPTTALTLTSFAPVPGNTVTPAKLSLTLTTYAPQIQLVVIPPVKALTLTTFAPVISTSMTFTPDTKALVLTTFAPTVTATVNQLVTPPTTALIITRFAPVVTKGTTFTPGKLSLVLTTFEPYVVSLRKPATTYSRIQKPLTNYGPAVKPTVPYGRPTKPLTTYAVSNEDFEQGITLDSMSVTLADLELQLTGYEGDVPEVTAKSRVAYAQEAKQPTRYV